MFRKSLWVGLVLLGVGGAACQEAVDVTPLFPVGVGTTVVNPDTGEELPFVPEGGTRKFRVKKGTLISVVVTYLDGTLFPINIKDEFAWENSVLGGNPREVRLTGRPYTKTMDAAGDHLIVLTWMQTHNLIPTVITQGHDSVRIIVEEDPPPAPAPIPDQNPLELSSAPRLNGQLLTELTIEQGDKVTIDLRGILRGGQPPYTLLILSADRTVIDFETDSDLIIVWKPVAEGEYWIKVTDSANRWVEVKIRIKFQSQPPPDPEPAERFKLTIFVEGDGEVHIHPPSEDGKYEEGDIVRLEHEAHSGSRFKKWILGDQTSQGSSLDVSMTGPRTVTAVFEPIDEPPPSAGPSVQITANDQRGTASDPLRVTIPAGHSTADVRLEWIAENADRVWASSTGNVWSGEKATEGSEWLALVAGTYFFDAKALRGDRQATAVVWVMVEATPPSPNDCVVSDWTVSYGPWSGCNNSLQNREVVWRRTIDVYPQNGGDACPHLVETYVESQPCTVEPLVARILSPEDGSQHYLGDEIWFEGLAEGGEGPFIYRWLLPTGVVISLTDDAEFSYVFEGEDVSEGIQLGGVALQIEDVATGAKSEIVVVLIDVDP